MVQTTGCIKWGSLYPADYANRLWSMVQRHTVRPTRLVCYTDDSSGPNEDIVALPREARVIAFTGKPDPDEAPDGRWEAPVWKKVYKHVRSKPWITEH